MIIRVVFAAIIVFSSILLSDETTVPYLTDCSKLRLGQYICPHPDYEFIDPKTQQPKGCTKENKAKVYCKAADGIICTKSNNSTFQKDIPCKWTNGYSFETALLLSIFLGMFGADRFYLGYPAIGLLKFCTLGFMFLGQLVDVILIATQVVGPADGSNYVIPYYGAGIQMITSNNCTYRLTQDEYLLH
ncbi:TM2 domain-containing protein CG10795 isoform X3 [Nilaparvata lugens]|uniref:TM2 domain-containing protein CG10795 isoform X1 n=1 Tax=Nilaparvata lugens TaxID=108931 RepID=UPI000B98D959|nr:TM2 domain-containing protein CG10795 isoform X1 [Nilaparvata lugens]XP_039278045.1 TM2 domain-containing protein CG10795 isoform X2 [Nilaparvata lugens]XP_039278046.1 TM2 domain-containing protein CG10795 isoform X3 [Nilaparvata lugens]